MLISVSWVVDTCRLKELLGTWKKSLESVWSSANLSWSICAHWGLVCLSFFFGCVFFVYLFVWVLLVVVFLNIKPFNKELKLQGFCLGLYTWIHRFSKDSRLVLGFLLDLKLIKLAKSTCLLFLFSLVSWKPVNSCRNWYTNYVVT